MLVLGIETSCDETAAALVRGSTVLSDVIQSQVALHAEYGGVVPELAARDHLRVIRLVVEQALAEASVPLEAVDAIAVTARPGLSGALLIGLEFARALAWSAHKPLIGVDHLVGHLLAGFLDFQSEVPPEPPSFPYIGLLASGGHTGIYRVDGPLPEQIVELGGTRDDAAGEAYDKVAKVLGLGYPGGPVIDRLAAEGDPDAVPLAVPMAQKSLIEFSFSGLKTNVMRWVHTQGLPRNDAALRNLCAAFQRRVVDALLQKTFAAAELEGVPRVALAGGVAANRELRERGAREAEQRNIEFIVPSRRACTDNAAMIAYAGGFRAAKGLNELDSIVMSPRTELLRRTRKGSGLRPPDT